MTEANVIDRAVLNRLAESFDGDRSFLAELLQTYLEDSPQQIAAMRAAVAAGDAEALRRAAHSLKSNSASFGAMPLAAACKELETLAKAANLAQAPPWIVEIEADYAAAAAALKKIGANA